MTRVEGILGADIALAQMAPRIEGIASSLFGSGAGAQPENGSGSSSWLEITLGEVGEKISGAYRQAVSMPATKLETAVQNLATGVANAWLSDM